MREKACLTFGSVCRYNCFLSHGYRCLAFVPSCWSVFENADSHQQENILETPYCLPLSLWNKRNPNRYFKGVSFGMWMLMSWIMTGARALWLSGYVSGGMWTTSGNAGDITEMSKF